MCQGSSSMDRSVNYATNDLLQGTTRGTEGGILAPVGRLELRGGVC